MVSSVSRSHCAYALQLSRMVLPVQVVVAERAVVDQHARETQAAYTSE